MTREEKLAELARQADHQVALAERDRKFQALQDGTYLNYEIGADQLVIRFRRFKLMIIPYSQIIDIEVASVLVNRSVQINLGNGRRKMCRIKKSRGWFRYVIVTPREPEILLDAVNAFRLQAHPITEMGDINASLPPFLRPQDDESVR
jgi:hypothetical protein